MILYCDQEKQQWIHIAYSDRSLINNRHTSSCSEMMRVATSTRKNKFFVLFLLLSSASLVAVGLLCNKSPYLRPVLPFHLKLHASTSTLSRTLGEQQAADTARALSGKRGSGSHFFIQQVLPCRCLLAVVAERVLAL